MRSSCLSVVIDGVHSYATALQLPCSLTWQVTSGPGRMVANLSDVSSLRRMRRKLCRSCLLCRSRRNSLPPHAVFRSKNPSPLAVNTPISSQIYGCYCLNHHVAWGSSKPEITMRFFSLATILFTHATRGFQCCEKDKISRTCK
jgi:hypothetical protein